MAASPFPVRREYCARRILLAGVGAVGSALLYIACMTPLVAHWTLLDRDRTEVSNLNRSPLFTVPDIGARKTKATQEYLAKCGYASNVLDGPLARACRIGKRTAFRLLDRPYK